MKLISELTCYQWMYVLVKVTSIIGLLYAAFSSMLVSNKSILRKSYNTLPDMKVYGIQKENIILNIPLDVIYENLKENTSLFLGFLVSAVGFFLDIIIETKEVEGKQLLMVAIPISLVIYIVLCLCSKLIAFLRCINIIKKIKNNKIIPVAYNVSETDNVDDENGTIHSSLYVKNCSWERMVVNGKVEDKNK